MACEPDLTLRLFVFATFALVLFLAAAFARWR